MIGGLDLAALSRLGRLRLSAFVALSAATGHAAAAMSLRPALLLPTLACLLLAAGASALNQLQEREGDGRMVRTRDRPIPSGAVTPATALVAALLLIGAGLGLLARFGPVPVGLGLAALFFYNGVYTPLKRRTAFAAVPGAVIGSLGPAIGWTAAGRGVTEPGLMALMLLFYLWQVPHFWLLSLAFQDDYRGAGYPTPVDRLGRRRLGRLIVVWTGVAVLTGLSLPLFGFLQDLELYLVLCLVALGLVTSLTGLLRVQGMTVGGLRRSFAGINLFVLVTMLLLLAESGL